MNQQELEQFIQKLHDSRLAYEALTEQNRALVVENAQLREALRLAHITILKTLNAMHINQL